MKQQLSELNMSEKIQRRYKIIFLGSWGCGKTSIIRRFVHDKFGEQEVPIEFCKRAVHVPGTSFSLYCQFWDTAGQERAGSLSETYYRKADAAVVVYDAHDPLSKKDVHKWLDELKKPNRLPKVIGIVANKADQVHEDKESADQWRDETPLFSAISAKTGANVKTFFGELARAIYLSQDEGAESSDNTFTAVLVGDKGVGKSSLVSRATLGLFRPDNPIPSAAAILPSISVTNEKRMDLQLVDSIEDEQSMRNVKRINAFVIVYDIGSHDPLSSVKKHLAEIQKKYGKEAVVALMANKADSMQGPCFGINQVTSFAMTSNIMHKIVSAKNGFGVNAAFAQLVKGHAYSRPVFNMAAAAPAREQSHGKCQKKCIIFQS